MPIQDLIAAAHGSTVDIFSLQAGNAAGMFQVELHSSLAHDAAVWKVHQLYDVIPVSCLICCISLYNAGRVRALYADTVCPQIRSFP